MHPNLIGFDPSRTDELIAMWRESFEIALGIVDSHPIDEQRRAFLTKVLPHNDVRLAMIDRRFVGFVAASKTSINQLYVRVGFQRQGIGGHMLAWAKDQSSGSLWLYTFARNKGACAFYERNGFKVVARGFEPEWQMADVRYEWSAARHSSGTEPRSA